MFWRKKKQSMSMEDAERLHKLLRVQKYCEQTGAEFEHQEELDELHKKSIDYVTDFFKQWNKNVERQGRK